MNKTLLLLLFILFSCTNNQFDYLGQYRLSAGSVIGTIISLEKNNHMKYLGYSDIGGVWYGYEGNYNIEKDLIILNIFQTVNDSTYSIRIDSLFIRHFDKIIFLIPKYSINKFDSTNNKNINKWTFQNLKNNSLTTGKYCFIKIGSNLLLDSLANNSIVWEKIDTLKMKLGKHWWIKQPPQRTFIPESLYEKYEKYLHIEDSLID